MQLLRLHLQIIYTNGNVIIIPFAPPCRHDLHLKSRPKSNKDFAILDKVIFRYIYFVQWVPGLRRSREGWVLITWAGRFDTESAHLIPPRTDGCHLLKL